MSDGPVPPTAFVFAPSRGLTLDVLTSSVGYGLRVILGRNNEGKTRTLRALHDASFVTSIDAERYPYSTGNAMWDRAWITQLAVDVKWRRSTPRRSEEQPEAPPEFEVAGGFFTNPNIPGMYGSGARIHCWDLVQKRPGIVVPTDRYFQHSAPLDEPPGLSSVDRWATILTALFNGSEHKDRETFKAISAAFSDITEGLTFAGRQKGREAIIQVDHGGGLERSLNECGDGLRDIIGILLFSEQHPTHDLLLDEPGLRLHPRAQRRLLGYLERQSHTRAVWISTHDGVFAGAPSVSEVFYVHRDPKRDVCTVEKIGDRQQIRSTMAELGWLPADAALADKVLWVEGPSDAAAFGQGGALGWLAESRPEVLGTLVLQLDGDGAMTGDNAEFPKRVAMLKQLAPHAQHLVLLDRDNRSKAALKTLEERAQKLDVELHILGAQKLENFWLVGDLLASVLTTLTGSKTTASAASELLAKQAHVTTDAKDVLKRIFSSLQTLWSERVVAHAAIAFLAARPAHASTKGLVAELAAVLRPKA